jgi:hypothetical protein
MPAENQIRSLGHRTRHPRTQRLESGLGGSVRQLVEPPRQHNRFTLQIHGPDRSPPLTTRSEASPPTAPTPSGHSHRTVLRSLTTPAGHRSSFPRAGGRHVLPNRSQAIPAGTRYRFAALAGRPRPSGPSRAGPTARARGLRTARARRRQRAALPGLRRIIFGPTRSHGRTVPAIPPPAPLGRPNGVLLVLQL